MNPADTTAGVLVIGAGVMGSGIAQVAAQAGHPVMLFDNRPGAAADARNRLATTLTSLVERGKFSEDEVSATLERISAIDTLDAAGGADAAARWRATARRSRRAAAP